MKGRLGKENTRGCSELLLDRAVAWPWMVEAFAVDQVWAGSLSPGKRSDLQARRESHLTGELALWEDSLCRTSTPGTARGRVAPWTAMGPRQHAGWRGCAHALCPGWAQAHVLHLQCCFGQNCELRPSAGERVSTEHLTLKKTTGAEQCWKKKSIL